METVFGFGLLVWMYAVVGALTAWLYVTMRKTPTRGYTLVFGLFWPLVWALLPIAIAWAVLEESRER